MLVHRYPGARASAFVYMYRVLAKGEDRASAHAILGSIWANNTGYELPKVPK